MAQDFAYDRTEGVPDGDTAIKLDRRGLLHRWLAPFGEAVAPGHFAFGLYRKRRNRVQGNGKAVERAWRAIAQFQLQLMNRLFSVSSRNQTGIQQYFDRASLKIERILGSRNVGDDHWLQSRTHVRR
jgi:hypothetical protein